MDSIQTAIQASHPTLLYFTSPRSPKEGESDEVFSRLEADLKGRARLFRIDGTADQELMRQYKVATYPTWILFKDGQEVWHDGGIKSYGELHDMVMRFV